MTTEPHRYVRPEVSDARVNRLWGKVSARLEARPRRIWRWLALSTALAGVAGGVVFVAKVPLWSRSVGEPALLAEAKLETGNEPLAVTLVEGSKMSLASGSELTVRGNQPTAVALALSRGKVVCDVTHRDNRAFTVVAGDVEVRVVGTLFSVQTTPGDNPRVEVSVVRGVVEVVSQRRPGIVARVAAGQSWIQNPESGQVEPNAVPVAPPGVAGGEAEPAAGANPDAKAASPTNSALASAPTARDLFEKAGESRRSGDAKAAARAYEELLRLHPGDGRASLSAFELGRLRMDRLADPAGAINALERAVASNIGPGFREDALARLVSVHASLGNFSACGRARDRYLASYPRGVHASSVASRCGARP